MLRVNIWYTHLIQLKQWETHKHTHEANYDHLSDEQQSTHKSKAKINTRTNDKFSIQKTKE